MQGILIPFKACIDKTRNLARANLGDTIQKLEKVNKRQVSLDITSHLIRPSKFMDAHILACDIIMHAEQRVLDYRDKAIGPSAFRTALCSACYILEES